MSAWPTTAFATWTDDRGGLAVSGPSVDWRRDLVGGRAGDAILPSPCDGQMSRPDRCCASGSVGAGHDGSAAMQRAAGLLALVLVTALSACAAPPAPAPPDARVPPFARVPYQPFSRDAVVAIAQREWRLFGAQVDDNPPGSYRPATADDKPERQQGLWQRVGEYWWLAMNPGAPEAAWTGKHDANGAGVSGEPGWRLCVVGCLRLICHADRRRGSALSLFGEPLRLHRSRQAAGAGPDVRLAGDRGKAREPMRLARAT